MTAAAISLVTQSPAARLEEQPVTTEHHGQWAIFWRSFREHKAAFVSLVILSTLTLACIVGPVLLPQSATDLDFSILDATAPSTHHLLGTDGLGRDVLARILAAGRISLLIGLMVALISATVGAAIGVSAGYFGGKVDEFLMWFVNVLLTVPSLPIMIAMSSVAASPGSSAGKFFGSIPPEWRMIIVMSMLGWMGISRIVRSQVRSLRKQEFVEAAEALGGSHLRIMVIHILPNTVSVLAVFTTLAVSTAILAESAMSFLGLGVSPPTATWGNMLLDARNIFTAVQYWWLTWFPAIAIAITVLCVNFVGDGLRDAFDPKARR